VGGYALDTSPRKPPRRHTTELVLPPLNPYPDPMIIQCPSCAAQARLPDSKEGAKVRCSQCGKVYVARPKGSQGRTKGKDNSSTMIIGGVVVVSALVIGLLAQGKGKGPPPPPPEETAKVAPESEGDMLGWESEGVLAARKLHTLLSAEDPIRLSQLLHGSKTYKRFGEELAAKTEAEGGSAEPRTPWLGLVGTERLIFLSDVARDMINGTDRELFDQWKPYHGWIEADDEGIGGGLIVRLKLSNTDTSLGLPDRHVEWHLARENGVLKGWNWMRWISPEEVTTQRRRGAGKIERRVLSDGSKVIEGKIRPIPYDLDVSPEMRARIDDLIARLVDPDGTKTFAIQNELREIGKPAIAPLMTKLATIPLDSIDNATSLNLVHLSLQGITGYQTSFQAHEALGTTKERQESGLKQWFGWFDRRYRSFKGRPEEEEDPLLSDPDFQPRNARERRELERARNKLKRGG